MSHSQSDTFTINFGFNLVARDSLPWHDKEHDNWRLLDALLARYLSLSGLGGIWHNATVYADGDRVVDPDLGTIWECEVAHTSPSTGTFAAARTANSTHWSAISFQVNARGAWAASTAYQVNDFVSFSNIYAAAITAHTSGSSFLAESTKWAYIIDARSTVSAAQSAASAAASSASSISLPLALASGGLGGSTAAVGRSTLGLGDLATQNASAISVTGGTITGSTVTLSSVRCNAAIIGGGTVSNLSTPIALADGGLAASTASGGRSTLGLIIGTDVQAYNVAILTGSTTSTLTVGYKATAYDLSTVSTGTITPDPANGNFQRIINAGAFTLSTPSATGDFQIVIQDTNNASAGAITAAGFTSTTGASLTTTNGDDFLLTITKLNGFTLLDKIKLQ